MVLRSVTLIYCALCLFSLLALGAGTFGWFGAERDPLSGVFAVMLALPWVAILSGFSDGAVSGLVIVIIGMAINLAIVVAIGLTLRKVRHQGLVRKDNPGEKL